MLIPGVDSLNHKRAHPITWAVSTTTASSEASRGRSSELSLSLVSETETSAGEEVLNNYGAKSNSSLILAYGFALPDNPDDTMSLKLASTSLLGPTQVRDDSEGAVEIGRKARGAEELWKSVRRHLLHLRGDEDGNDTDENPIQDSGIEELELHLDVLETLRELIGGVVGNISSLLAKKGLEVSDSVRSEKIGRMQGWYLQGQLDIATDLQAWLQTQGKAILNRQDELGVVFEDEIMPE